MHSPVQLFPHLETFSQSDIICSPTATPPGWIVRRSESSFDAVATVRHHARPSSLTSSPDLTSPRLPPAPPPPTPPCRRSHAAGAVVMRSDCGPFAPRLVFLASLLLHPVRMTDGLAAVFIDAVVRHTRTRTHKHARALLQPRARLKVSWCVPGEAARRCSQLSALCCLTMLPENTFII